MAEELLKFVVDDSELVSAFDNASAQASQLDAQAQDLSVSLEEAFDVDSIETFDDNLEKTNKDLNTTTKETAKLSKETQKTNVSVQQLSNSVGILGGAFNGVRTAVRRVGLAFSALAKNPILLFFTGLIAAGAALVKAFTSTKDGAEFLQRASAGLGAALDVVRDIVVQVGTNLVAAFNDPIGAIKELGTAIVNNIINRFRGIIELASAVGGAIKAAFSFDTEALRQSAADARQALVQVATGLDADQQQAVADAISNTADEIAREAAEAARLTGVLQDVNDQQRKLSVTRAQLNKQLAESRLIAQDTNKTLAERAEALDTIRTKEEQQLQAEVAAQRARVNALKALAAQSDSSAATLDEIAQAEIRLANLQTQSRQKLLAIDRQRLQLERQAAQERERAVQLELEIQNQLITNEQTRLENEATQAKAARDKRINDEIKDADKRKELLKASEQILANDLQAIRDESASKKLQKQKEANNKELQDAIAAANLQVEVEQLQFQREQELERQRFNEIARTEEEITAFQEQQANERIKKELEFQLRRLRIIQQFGKDATAQEKARLAAEIKLTETQLAGINSTVTTKEKEKFDIRKGFINKEAAAVQKGLEQAGQAVSQALQITIDALQKEIDFRNERINSLQTDLSNEIRLAELGKAANVSQVQDQLAQEKAARDKAEREKEQAARAQFAVDTALQASNLITAISGLYSSLAGALPFGIGVALATALSGVLIGSFIASKVSAANAAGFYKGTEHVGKALGKRSKAFSGRDAYLGMTGDGTPLRFDGEERIVSGTDNRALGDISNADLPYFANLGQQIAEYGLPSVMSFSKKRQRVQDAVKDQQIRIKKDRDKAYQTGFKEATAALLAEQQATRKAVESQPYSYQVSKDEWHLHKDGKLYKHKDNRKD